MSDLQHLPTRLWPIWVALAKFRRNTWWGCKAFHVSMLRWFLTKNNHVRRVAEKKLWKYFRFLCKEFPQNVITCSKWNFRKDFGRKLLPRNRVTGSVGFADSREDEAPDSSLPAKSWVVKIRSATAVADRSRLTWRNVMFQQMRPYNPHSKTYLFSNQMNTYGKYWF